MRTRAISAGATVHTTAGDRAVSLVDLHAPVWNGGAVWPVRRTDHTEHEQTMAVKS
jgi:hypothetical protein